MARVPALVVEKALLDDPDRLHAAIVCGFLVVRTESNGDVVGQILEVFKIDGAEHGIVDFASWA